VTAATVTALVTSMEIRIGIPTVLLETGWVFVLATLVASAAYRIMLSRYDHRERLAGMEAMNPVHLWFMQRETRVDHIAIPLTVGALLNTVVFGIFIISQLFEAAIRTLVSALTFR
jgi:hypothetical protein